jgi:hypothetical protein
MTGADVALEGSDSMAKLKETHKITQDPSGGGEALLDEHLFAYRRLQFRSVYSTIIEV